MTSLINHWYWARGQAGPYTTIASHITAEARYGHSEIPIFMLASGAEIIADDSSRVVFEELGTYTDVATRKPVANFTRYTYTDGDERYIVSFTRYRDLAANRFVDQLHGPEKVAARLAGFDGAYLRFAGELRIEHWRSGAIVDIYADSALWELMYPGKSMEHQVDHTRAVA